MEFLLLVSPTHPNECALELNGLGRLVQADFL